MEENKGMGNNKAQNYDSGDIMEATNVQSSKSTNEVPNLEEAHDENKEGALKLKRIKGKGKLQMNPHPRILSLVMKVTKNIVGILDHGLGIIFLKIYPVAQKVELLVIETRDSHQKTLSFQQLKKEDGQGGSSVLTSIHFDVDACRQALARMIIVDELPFKFVEGEGFRYFMSIVQPKLPIPGRISAARDCWSLYIIDNASSNDVAISYLKSRMEDWNTHPLKGEHMHVRCCAHILNLVVQDGLKEWNSSISKIMNAVRYVRASPGRMDKFRRCIKEARLLDKSIVQLDVPTRWNSTYLMLESALKFQKAFKRLGEKCVEYVMLQGAKYVTSSQYFNEHVLALITFKNMRDSGDLMLGMMAEKIKVKYDKYWGNVKNMNMLIFVAAVLDPRNKFRFVEWGMNKIYEKDIAEFMSQKVKEELHEMFEKYRFFANQGQLETCVQSSNEKRTIKIDSIDDELAVEFEKDMDLHENLNKNEVDLYLMEALEKKSNPNFDILNCPLLAQECRSSPISTDVEELVEDLEKLGLDLVPIPQLNEEQSDAESD
ncbi:hypothetical protein F3Y22_tig00005566pilonHSYRG00018 [Hibiscus syriacus]|uniref:hAT-like transposase RNase-H fold domain-containing protein n=1 Tax=Hibiscus syriacus TaxID=106335 RepID=A0A6A3CJ32_HIBSY|nr:hypothetical protein F3Y22_tig00005566pilonHSYRG00018 [Hibiscus syriacus]